MAHLLTWTRIRLLARPSTIYSRYREGKHHFRWLLRWRNLPVRASPPSSPLLRLTAYLRLASCLSTPGWMCIGIEYRQAGFSPSLLYCSFSSLPPLSVLSFSLSFSNLFPFFSLPRRRPPLPPRLRNLLPVPMKVATWSIESLLSLSTSLAYVLPLSRSLSIAFFLQLSKIFSIPVSRFHPFDELRCHNNRFVALSQDLGYDSITSWSQWKRWYLRNRQASLNIRTSACQLGFYAVTASEYLWNISCAINIFGESAV